MLIANITEQSNAFLVTQDVEKYVWMEDTSAKTFNFEVQSTDNEVENVIYYTHNSIEGKEKECSIHQLNIHEMNIKEQITSMSCGYNCYVIATNSLKIACGIDYTLALTNEGKLYCWGGPYFYETTFCSNHSGNNDISPIQMNIINVKNLSDIAVINYTNFVKSSKNELVYAWGFIFKRQYKEPAVCEYTNAFDISNSMTARSPISVADEFINEEFHILKDLETAFNDQSTSDLTIMVEKQSIYVHKVILKIRSTYFRSMFQTNYVENRQRYNGRDDVRAVIVI
ncbi:RCC1 and BTB domain-containing protein 1 [Acromyrmex echinatior]|uniref:RCC1 and BTB domain-containing protein 1 n=1 Tax=Acromyrmex echinatior TaxID=103372 RepID=F4WFJ5_ACREC|nr:RCC1 and BTB domain-containing protein 1 [Acromyrmex echinatior]